MSPFWLRLWIFGLSLSWLLPVAAPPWSTFPADSWMALMGLSAGVFVFARSGVATPWHVISIWVAGLAVVPWVQLALGTLPWIGQAWISSLYLLGFLLALLLGAQWELVKSMQLAGALFAAFGVAAVASVGLQLYAFTGVAESGYLGALASGLSQLRPSGNLGQPNQLATLLLWGCGACLWGYLRKTVSGLSAVFVAAVLVLGLALTQSRTGALVLTLMLVMVWFWRGLWPSRAVPWAVSGLYLFYWVCPIILRGLSEALLLTDGESFVRLAQGGELRLMAWRLFMQAAIEGPWLGYGWTETTSAQMAVADQFNSLAGVFAQSHNIVLDLVLWVGLPIGLLTTAVLGYWSWQKLTTLRRAEDAVLLMVVIAAGVHAMLEFPHQYAYFLLPIGFVMGILNTRLSGQAVWVAPRLSSLGLCLAGVLALGITFRDYVQVESSYTLLRLEQGILGQGREPLGEAPDVWVLTHLSEWIRLSRYKIHPAMSRQEVQDLEALTRAYPSLSSAFRLAKALALNGRPDEARTWLGRICKFTSVQECALAQRTWQREAGDDPRTDQVRWP